MTPEFSRLYRCYVLTVLTAVYTLNLVDRGLIALLLESIKEDLRLSDTQLGLVTGIVFGLFYAVLGLPIARWADRGDRARISSLAIGLWGVTVMAHLFVANYLQLLTARMSAAVGEAGCKPPTYSLVGDYYPAPSERTRAMAIYWLGSPLGLILSFFFGGWLNDRFGWRLTFFIMGIPGLLLAALVFFTVREPRQRPAGRSSSRQTAVPVKEVLRILWNRRSCRHVSIALILVYALSYGIAPWEVAFMRRSHAMSTADIGVWIGGITSGAGIVGLTLGGYVANRWFSGDERGQLRLSAVMVSSVVPSFMWFLLAPQKYQALMALGPFALAFIFFMAPTFALLQRLVPNSARATVLAIIMFLANLLGMGLGPQIVGILSDLLASRYGTDSLRYALLLTSFTGLWAAYHFWQAGQTVAGDLQYDGTMRLATME